MNSVQIVGNLGSDPELRQTSSGTSVCNLSVATTRRYENGDGQWEEKTEWHRIVCWGKTAENCDKYLAKGRRVAIEGRLQTNEWTDNQGRDRETTEIVASNVEFLGGGSGGGRDGQPKRQPSDGNPAAGSQGGEDLSWPDDEDEDDIPF